MCNVMCDECACDCKMRRVNQSGEEVRLWCFYRHEFWKQAFCIFYTSLEVCALCVCILCFQCTFLHKFSHHLGSVFPHTLWLASLTTFGNVWLQLISALRLKYAPGKRRDLCAARLVVMSDASAVPGPMRMVQLSVECLREQPELLYGLQTPQTLLLTIHVFSPIYIPSVLPELIQLCVFFLQL